MTGAGAIVRRSPRLLPAAAAVLIAACASADGPSSPAQQQQTGSIAVNIAGLPTGVPAAVTVTQTDGFTQSVPASATLTGLTLGSYTVAAQAVGVDGTVYTPSPATQVAVVSFGGQPASASITYTITTGSLLVSASGLPAGAVAVIDVSGPDGYSQSVDAGTAITGLVPGSYQLSARPVESAEATWTATASPVSIDIAASASLTTLPISYTLSTGSLAITIEGLPGGAVGSVAVTGPDGFQQSLNADEALTNLEPGSYTISGDPVSVGLDVYSAPPATVAVVASLTPVPVDVAYAVASGRLLVSVTGLPAGTNASVSVSGPGGYSANLAASATLAGLEPGTYVVSASPVSSAMASYAPAPSSQQVDVPATNIAVGAGVAYSLSTGSLAVTISGLPTGVSGDVTITGPGGYADHLSASGTLSKLTPGTYVLAGARVDAGSDFYLPASASQSVTVVATVTPSSASVAYQLASAKLSIAVSGLPGGVPATIVVSGPDGYSTSATTSTDLTGLTPGTYVVTASSVTSGSTTFAPQASSQSVALTASTLPTTVSVAYQEVRASLAVTIGGLPGGVSAAVTVTGPGGFSANLTASQTLNGLAAGTYGISASNVSSGGSTYIPSPTTQNVSVTAGGSASAAVAYALAASLNLTIGGVYITQSVQTPTMDVPLVAGRDGLLRVFVIASEANSVQPAVRVRLYNGTTLIDTRTISSPGASVPQTVSEGTLNASWNVRLPAAELQPGTSLLVDVDPTNAVTESSESDNVFPPSGTPLALDVRTVSTYSVRLVPVAQSVNGKTGNVSNANKAQFVATMLHMFPLASIDADVRATYTTSAPALKSNDANNAWEQILSEINALRTADASTRSYYGVVHTTYTSGVAGLGYVPGRSAIGWDYLPSGAQVMAHETGHNFGRFHAPSCGASGTDPGFPYGDGKIGMYGYDLSSGTLRDPSSYYDLMGYCNPVWISDYTYEGILDYRAAHPVVSTTTSGAMLQPALLVWGHVHDGELTLEPAYDVVTRPRLPTSGGPSTLSGYAPDGTQLFSFSFTGERVADTPNPNDETFAFAIPLDSLHGRALDRLTLRAMGKVVEHRASGAPGQPVIRDASEEPAARQTASGQVLVTWKDDGLRGALIRDGGTGEILSFGRGGSAIVHTTSAALDVTLSDGVRSVRRRLTPR